MLNLSCGQLSSKLRLARSDEYPKNLVFFVVDTFHSELTFVHPHSLPLKRCTIAKDNTAMCTVCEKTACKEASGYNRA